MQPVRGTKDYIFEDAEKFEAIINIAQNISQNYNFKTIHTPIFEETQVFSRSMGEESDVVSKEMYSFDTKGGENITLRPEFTAGIVRAFISNGLQQHIPLKLFSYGPVFRYERPQKGRQRQFHQVNFEYFGNPEPTADAEMIFCASQLLENLGVSEGLSLNINTLGDSESRKNYQSALVEYLSKYQVELSEDSKRRLAKNPLRILDSKDENDKKIIATAPLISDYLNDFSKNFFEKLLNFISGKIKTEIKVNPKIVRGLDYYSHSVFEFILESENLGSQNTILAGGRYDALVEQMGGKQTPAIGFAAGVERLMLASQISRKNNNLLAIISDFDDKALETASILRAKNINCEVIFSGKFAKKIQKADKIGSKNILFIFEDKIEIKNLDSGEQKITNISEVIQNYSSI
ncbi:MAG: histidine--tRNA ligase [Rickettsiales bacterium]|nr:histidine--tRNA ligase [Rickettsiales bacterium]